MRAFLEQARRPVVDMRRMNFELTPEQKLIRDTARELATREIAAARRRDRSRAPASRARSSPGWASWACSGIDGARGAGAAPAWTRVSYAVALEEIARACASTAVVMSVQNSLVCAPILHDGTDAQRARWLPDLAAGKKIGCFALSEPEAGSDAKAQRTPRRARRATAGS